DELPDGGPWGTHLPRRFIAWRGQPPQGTLTLRPRPVRLRTHSHNDVVVGPGGVAVSARLTVEAVSGAVGSVDLRLAAPLPGGAAPHLEVVSKKESRRVLVHPVPGGSAAQVAALLTARQPLELAALLGPQSQGQLWRLPLSRPLLPGEPLTLVM